mgnify:CR=1 FL=1
MKKIIILLCFSLSFVFCVYNVGQVVSDSDQNVSKSTCFAGNDYIVNDNWKLADWNGMDNGGQYNVIFIEMSATW